MMGLKDRIEKWKEESGENPLFSFRYPGEKESSQQEGFPYNPYQQQLKIDKQNNITPDTPGQNFRDNVTEWELINHNASIKRLVKKSQSYDIRTKINNLITLGKSQELEEYLNTLNINPDQEFPISDSYYHPLIKAIFALNRKVVKLLLDKFHFDINMKFSGGRTPLYFAAKNYDLEGYEKNKLIDKVDDMLRFLIELGANPDIRTDNGTSVQDILRECGESEALDEIQEQIEWDKLSPEEQQQYKNEQKEKRDSRELNRRIEEVKQKEQNQEEQEEELDPQLEYLNHELDQAKTHDQLIDLWKKINKLENSPQKNLLLEKLKGKTKVASFSEAEIPSNFTLIDTTKKEKKGLPKEDTFFKKIYRFKQKKEIQPKNTFTAEPSTGLDPSIYYKTPGVIL
jgi:hypothetical protein